MELISDQKCHSHSQDRYGNNMTCANNCRGVNPNAVIIGGTAVLAAAAVTPLQVLTPLGLGALGGGAAVVGQMMNRRSCPATRPCRVIDLHITSQMVKLKTVAFFRLAIVETQGGGNAAEPLGLDREGSDAPEPASRGGGRGQGRLRCHRVC